MGDELGDITTSSIEIRTCLGFGLFGALGRRKLLRRLVPGVDVSEREEEPRRSNAGRSSPRRCAVDGDRAMTDCSVRVGKAGMEVFSAGDADFVVAYPGTSTDGDNEIVRGGSWVCDT